MASHDIPQLELHDGTTIDQLGLGVYKVPEEETERVVTEALEVGYRLIDTASMYGNEAAVGRAVRHSGIARDTISVATKFWLDDLGYDNTLRAFERTQEAMGLDYIDHYLIHWPAPERNLFVESWAAMLALKNDGKVRSIGVCNFHPEHIERIVAASGVAPAINQVEMHPWLTQEPLRAFHHSHGIVTQAWSPLARGQVLDEESLVSLAGRYGKSVSQIVLRWHIQRGDAVVAKSVRRERLTENVQVFDFELSAEDMLAISGLNRDYRTGVDPNDRN
jgi:2,5-diketo-D-gluconate reductase A